MSLLKWIAAGAVGGIVGAAIWAAITYYAHAEIGWIAWGIGGLVGFGVRLAAGEREEGAGPGVTAVAVAIGSILLGKFLAAHFLVASLVGDGSMDVDNDDMIVQLADEIVKERQAKGMTVVFPNGGDLESASTQADYPPDIWQQASAKWNSVPVEQRTQQMQELKTTRQAIMRVFQGTARSTAFYASFSLFDLLWFLLAAGTAYRLGAGNVSDDD
jgi:hypothetical protein